MARTLVHRLVALLAIVVLLPVYAVLALLVLASSPGPVLFRQTRAGRHGRPFQIYKFRTMVDGADRLAANVSADGDPRVTPVGRVLRAYHLDELPQLFNVVKGDMDLVGPRPETPEHVALYTDEERRVLELRPGIAGPSTLAFMDEAERLAASPDPVGHYRDVLLHERVRADLACLQRQSLLDDLRVLLRQVLAIVRS